MNPLYFYEYEWMTSTWWYSLEGWYGWLLSLNGWPSCWLWWICWSNYVDAWCRLRNWDPSEIGLVIANICISSLEFHIDDGCSIRFLIRWLWRMHLADIMNIMVMLGLWKWICIQCKSIACICAIMQWLAWYPSCPDDCMMRWQYLAKQSRSRWVPLSWACFNADAAAAVWTWFGNVGCSSERREKGTTCGMDSIDGYADQRGDLQVQVCEWHNHASQDEWALRICAYAHVSICTQMTTNLPGLAFSRGDGWLRLSHEGEDYGGWDQTSSCSYLWMMSYVSFIFPNWVLLWWLAVLQASMSLLG